MRRTIALLFVLLCLCGTLVSCSGDKIVGNWGGNWDGTDIEISFEAEGICGYRMDGRSYLGTWEGVDGKLTVKADSAGEELVLMENAPYVAGESSLTIELDGKTIQLKQ